MRNLVPTLTELGEYVAAVQALGAVTRPEQTPTYGLERKRLSAAEETLRAKLGAADFAHHSASQQRINVFVNVDRVSRA